MKKVFLLVFTLICFGISSNAQSCKISGANDGSTIMVTNDYQEGNKIVVNLDNDSESTCANVTVEVEITYTQSTCKETYTGRGKSCPDSSCRIEIPINLTKGTKKMSEYKVKKVSGNKCESF